MHHLWMTWTDTAVQHETAAWRVREDALKLERPADLINGEFRSALIGLTAASHALDGLYGEIIMQSCRGLTGRRSEGVR
jgi:hypothetical protein